MTINVKMLVNRQGPAGVIYAAGSSYDIEETLAHRFVSSNAALYTSGAMPFDSGGVPVMANSNLLTGVISITGPGNYRKVIYPNVSVSIGLAPNVTWDNTGGGFTSPTSLGVTYSRGLWLYFNGVGINGTTGGPATSGYYWCVMSSATQGIAYAENFNPEIGAVPNLVTSTTPLVTVIGTNAPTLNTYITAAKVTIAGGSIGANGILKGHDFLSFSSSANTKYASVRLGGEPIAYPAGLSSQVSARREYWMYNRGAEDANLIQTFVYFGPTTGQPTLASINTAVDQPLVYALYIAAATDFLILNSAALSSENT